MKFSVVIPSYNKVEYIERAINSVLCQSEPDFELIVVDDGSTDGTYEKAREILENRAENCVVLRQKNAGVADARNNGANFSKGQYISFLDADDWWEPDYLQEMSILIKEYPQAGMYGSGYYIVKNGHKRIAPIGVPLGFKRGIINYCRTYSNTMCMPISSSSVTIPRDVFLGSGGFERGISLGEDFLLWIRLALKYPVVFINLPLSNYFQDIPPRKRATRRLHEPSKHMIWNMDFLQEDELRNRDLKVLLDKIRANGLFRFYLSKEYHDLAVKKMECIDWSNVSSGLYDFYHSSLFYQRVKFKCREYASRLKQFYYLNIRNR